MTPTTVTNAARMLAKRRVKQYGKQGMKEIAAKATATKIQKFGPEWAAKAGRGERLEPLTPRSSAGEEF